MFESTYNAKRGGRQFSMFMSENICILVDLFDKAVAEGASNHWKRGRKVTTRQADRQTDKQAGRQVGRQTDSQPARLSLRKIEGKSITDSGYAYVMQ